jgi:hypothetical protein
MKPDPNATEGDLWLWDTLAVNHKLCNTMDMLEQPATV